MNESSSNKLSPPTGGTPGQEAEDGWELTPRPWRRLFARLLDLQVNIALFVFLTILTAVIYDEVLASPGPDSVADMGPMVFLFALFFGTLVGLPALCIGMFGTTLGKWLLGIRVAQRGGYGIGVAEALTREIAAVLAGAGLYVPIAMPLAMVLSYVKLSRDGVTLWDESKPWTVMYRPFGARQIAVGVLSVLLMPVSLVALRLLIDVFEAY